ncbi:hypothetical protein B5S28_g2763 [[Candida] boidinii]|nr:hypothetical protein B5S28_g2763 [[Candida] boidinii]OWB62588.1 hypothetical protein B5S29_g3522 [[Candida] boidinii]OWB70756.1 hypothetical protein B5S31_g435 [[Candida] boidinii]OWB76134.1 hypothetical protein B5S32_g284 [[Candida] boidinii]
MEKISIGNELKDSYKSVDKWVKSGLNWLTDINEFYSERASIEREYSNKLKLLCTEHFKRKAKNSSVLSVGDSPTITPGSLESASLVAWNELLTQTEALANERLTLANNLDKKIANDIIEIQRKYDAIRDKWKLLNDELTNSRDKYYEEVAKSKKDYDLSCQAMEHQRSKNEKSSDSEKNKLKYNKKEIEMNNFKNNYLIKINVANRLKDKYYYQDLPEILDGLQDLNEARVCKLNSYMLLSTSLERKSFEKIIEFTNTVDEVVKQNLPMLDTAMFVKHNMNSWKEPQDFYYIPCSIWHDDETMIIKSNELEELKIKMSNANSTYDKYYRICENEKQQLEELIQDKKEIMGDVFSEVKMKQKEEFFKFEDRLIKSINQLQKFTSDDTKKVIAEVEMETIQSATGDLDLTITRQVEVKKKKKFGFLKLGSIHHNNNNGGGDNDVNSDGDNDELESFGDMSISAPKPSSAGKSGSTKIRLFSKLEDAFNVGPTTSNNDTNGLFGFGNKKEGGSVTIGKALYGYDAAGDDEVDIKPGDVMEVTALDDGSGWTQVVNKGQKGLVPTSYLQIEEQRVNNDSSSIMTGGKKQGPKVAPKRGAKKVKYMEILYAYEPVDEDELGVNAGDKVLVLKEDDGSGWTEGEIEGIRGLFPTSYGKMI